MEDIDFERRFGGIARLYGSAGLQKFKAAHVCVVGVGGVGSWVAEALARNAIGTITLIDLDNVAESNINRQIQALSNTLGQAKVTALAERIAQINPFCRVIQVEDFVAPENLDVFIKQPQFDYVIDAIDSVKAKTALIAFCTEQEPLLSLVRKRLRQNHGFSRGSKNKFGIDAVFSMEPLKFPEASCDVPEALDNANPEAGISGLNCAGFGSTMVVTATFAMFATALVLKKLCDA